jgi:hypothetical protein
MMKDLGLGIIVAVTCLIFASRAIAQTSLTPDQLIDQLAQINCNGPGLYSYFPYEDFWAVVSDLDAKEHLEGPKPDCVPDAMRALVRLGPQALPALARHISDMRPTDLKIGTKEKPGEIHMGGQIFAEEYESRAHAYNEFGYPSSFLDKCGHGDCYTGRGFREPYTVRIGDVCFTLIGQIVNRYMVAARYQPTGLVVVNSPIETPLLAEHVRADWAEVDAEGLKNSLLSDLHRPLRKLPPGFKRYPPGFKRLARESLTYEERESLALRSLYAGALRRLRFYYPDTYTSLSGDDLVKRKAFEHEEAEQKAEYAKADPEQFIDGLTSLNCPIPGVSDTGTFGGFLAEEGSMKPFSTALFEQRGQLRYPVPCQNASVQNVMHFGLTALPALIRHLDDTRPTGLIIGQDLSGKQVVFGGQYFADEYDARHRTWPLVRCGADPFCDKMRPFEKPYTVKVGDICFVLIGQIVNRHLNAVRYQPTAIVVVNSPIETPALAARVKADWASIDSDGLKNSLLADLHMMKLKDAPDVETETQVLAYVHSDALRRLRYYFPDTYASLTGDDHAKREAFEKAERDRPKD